VDDWTKKDKILHVMRDHPFHGVLVLGGTYGIYQRNESMVKRFDKIRLEMIRQMARNDQINLSVSIIPTAIEELQLGR